MKTKKLEHILFKNTLKNFVGSKTTLPPFCREGGFEHRRLLFPGICQMFSGIFRYFPKFVFAWTRITCNDNESWIGTNNKAGRVVASLNNCSGCVFNVFPGFFQYLLLLWKRIKCNDNASWIGTQIEGGSVASSLKGFVLSEVFFQVCFKVFWIIQKIWKEQGMFVYFWSVYTLAIEFETSGGRVVSSLNTFAFRYFKYYQKHCFFIYFFKELGMFVLDQCTFLQ